MIETSAPVLVVRPDLRNTTDILAERVRLHPLHVAFQVRPRGRGQRRRHHGGVVVPIDPTSSVAQATAIVGGRAEREVVRVAGDRASTVIFLPLSHVLARALQLPAVATGMRAAHVSDTSEVMPALAGIRPTFLVVVPRVLQKIQGPRSRRPRRRAWAGRSGPRSTPRSRGAGTSRRGTRPAQAGPRSRCGSGARSSTGCSTPGCAA